MTHVFYRIKCFFIIINIFLNFSCLNKQIISHQNSSDEYIPPLIKSSIKSERFYNCSDHFFSKNEHFFGINFQWAKSLHLEQTDIFSIYLLKKNHYVKTTDRGVSLKNKLLYHWLEGKIIACNSAAPMIAIGRLFGWNKNLIIKHALELRTAYRFGFEGDNKLSSQELRFISSYIINEVTPDDYAKNRRIMSFCVNKKYYPAGNYSLKEALKNKYPLVNIQTNYYLTANANLEQQISQFFNLYEYNCEIAKLHVNTIQKKYNSLVAIEEKKYRSIEELKNILKKYHNRNSAVILYQGCHIHNVVGYYINNNKFEVYVTETLHEQKFGTYFALNSSYFSFHHEAYCYIIKKR